MTQLHEANEVFTRSEQAVAGADALDGLADRIQQTVQAAFASGGEQGQKWADVLHGTWLGHPLHPALTTLPIGFWTSSVVLDLLSALGAKRMRPAADSTLVLGLLGAAAAAASGLTDYQHAEGRSRRIGAMHAVFNSAASLLFAGSLLLRVTGNRGKARMASMAGLGISTYSAYLGGSLITQERLGVNHAPRQLPVDWTAACPESDMNGDMHRCHVGGVPVVIIRQGETLFALADECAHLGASLANGSLENACVTCPWHGSTFRLSDGAVVHGPSAFDQPALETRVAAGMVEVRARDPRS